MNGLVRFNVFVSGVLTLIGVDLVVVGVCLSLPFSLHCLVFSLRRRIALSSLRLEESFLVWAADGGGGDLERFF
jgi:hypothetical protein